MSADALVDESAPSLLHTLLEAQQTLSAVETFSKVHDEGDLPANAEHYRALIPTSRAPGPGEQFAFRVDLDACTGCKACVTACHSLNGLAPDETWRDVGRLLGTTVEAPVQQTVTTACHHCADPGCLNGCPVQAYDKDPVTGIVRHLDDQCIGCQYCVMKCPYDVPKYSEELGIVRKCDMCTDRLGAGEAPACVQGCPNSAISIEIVRQDESPAELIPGAGAVLPNSDLTRPTTRYVSAHEDRTLRSADGATPHPAPSHDPLAVMLVATQLSVGLLFFDSLLGDGPGRLVRLAVAALAGAGGLAAATLHLGRPLYAFRAFLGWRTSWMSREILAFGAYVPALVGTLALTVAGELGVVDRGLIPLASALTLALGLVAGLCSVMIYADTGRTVWSTGATSLRFGATALLLGAIAAAATTEARAALLGFALLIGIAKLLVESSHLLRSEDVDLQRTRRLLAGVLYDRVRQRWATAAVATLAACGALALGGSPIVAATLCIASAFAFAASELVERRLFFVAEATRRMPGG